MEVLDAITKRRSFRSYKPKPVPKEILEKVLDACRYVSSWSNTQCWELHILSGKPLDELRQALAKKMMAEKSGTIRLCEICPNLRMIFTLTHLDHIFDIRDSLAEAIQP